MNNLVEKVINYNNTFSMRFFMGKNMTYHRKKIVTIFFAALAVFLILAGNPCFPGIIIEIHDFPEFLRVGQPVIQVDPASGRYGAFFLVSRKQLLP